MEEWQKEVDDINSAYRVEVDLYRDQLAIFEQETQDFVQLKTERETARARWTANQTGASQLAEGLIRQFEPGFGWTYVDKNDSSAYQQMLLKTWAAQLFIILVLFGAIMFLQKRKDVA